MGTLQPGGARKTNKNNHLSLSSMRRHCLVLIIDAAHCLVIFIVMVIVYRDRHRHSCSCSCFGSSYFVFSGSLQPGEQWSGGGRDCGPWPQLLTHPLGLVRRTAAVLPPCCAVGSWSGHGDPRAPHLCQQMRALSARTKVDGMWILTSSAWTEPEGMVPERSRYWRLCCPWVAPLSLIG